MQHQKINCNRLKSDKIKYVRKRNWCCQGH